MRVQAIFPIEGSGRATEGRRLASLALHIQLAIVFVGSFLLSIFGVTTGPLLSGALGSAFIVLGIWAISREILWIALVFAALSVLGILGSLNAFQLPPLSAASTLFAAVIDFVFVSGVAIWWRHLPVEKATQNTTHKHTHPKEGLDSETPLPQHRKLRE